MTLRERFMGGFIGGTVLLIAMALMFGPLFLAFALNNSAWLLLYVPIIPLGAGLLAMVWP